MTVNNVELHVLEKSYLNAEQIHTPNTFLISFPTRKIRTNIDFRNCRSLLEKFCLLRNRTRLSLIHPVFAFVALKVITHVDIKSDKSVLTNSG